MELNVTLAIPDDWKYLIIEAIANNSNVNVIETPWVTEQQALDMMQLTNIRSLREIARKNNIAIRQPTKALFYNKKDIIKYIGNSIKK